MSKPPDWTVERVGHSVDETLTRHLEAITAASLTVAWDTELLM